MINIKEMRLRKKFEIIPPKNLTKTRRMFEDRVKNINFRNAIIHAQHRHNLKMERDRLHGLLYTNLNPALLERVKQDGNRIFEIVGNT